MEFRKKWNAMKALMGKGEEGTPNPLQTIMQHPERYRLEAYLEDTELVVRIKPKEPTDISPKAPERKIIGYRLRSHN